jgi:hypothetical protein
MSHPLAERAWRELYGTEPSKELVVRYSGKFSGYNGRITGYPRSIVFSLSHRFEEASDEIQIGVMQHLLNRLNRTRIDTLEIQLYNSFIKKLTDYVETTTVDPYLKERFDAVNKEYFDGFMMTPNLVWGTYSLTKLGHYSFATDTISVSTALKEDEMLLDYVLYHEMLHKKHKFSERAGGFTRSHTKTFRSDEKRFKAKDAEKRLNAFLRRKRMDSRHGSSRPRPPRRRFLRSLFEYF